MNHLAHLALAGDEIPLLLGAILGDHVKGRLKGDHDTSIERGIQLHRAIDAYTDQHPDVAAALSLLQPRFRRYGGIMLDVQFDYLLANSFERFHSSDLVEFSKRSLDTLVAHDHLLTNRAALQVRRMQNHNSLARHGTTAYLENSLQHLSGRLKRANPLAEAYAECLRVETHVAAIFENFYPDLLSYVEDWKKQN